MKTLKLIRISAKILPRIEVRKAYQFEIRNVYFEKYVFFCVMLAMAISHVRENQPEKVRCLIS